MTDVHLLRGGMVYTADPAGSFAETVAVADGRIRAVGSDNEVTRAFPGAAETRLEGRTLVPGFIDAHNHYLATGEGRIVDRVVGLVPESQLMRSAQAHF